LALALLVAFAAASQEIAIDAWRITPEPCTDRGSWLPSNSRKIWP